MTEQIGVIVDAFVLLSYTPFLIWLNGNGSLGQPLVLALIPLFYDVKKLRRLRSKIDVAHRFLTFGELAPSLDLRSLPSSTKQKRRSDDDYTNRNHF